MLGIKVPFSVDGKRYRKGLQDLRKDTKQWGEGIKGTILGAFAVGAIVQQFTNLADTLRETEKAARLLGVSFGEMNRLRVISERFNVELDDTKELLSNVNERIFESAIQAGLHCLEMILKGFLIF